MSEAEFHRTSTGEAYFLTAPPSDERKRLCPSGQVPQKTQEATPPYSPPMTRITIDTPCYFITSVMHDRLPIFRTDKLKEIACNALNEARKSADLLYFAYAVMPDHFHFVTDGKRSPSGTLRYLNGVTAKRVLDYLKENEFTSSLLKLRETVKERGYKHSVWEHHSDKFLLTSEDMFMQKVEYIHNNPVKDGLAELPEDYF